MAAKSEAAAAGGRAASDLAPIVRQWRKFAVIGAICMAQDFPAAIVNTVMPAVARANGLPASSFWLFSLAQIPFWACILWAPLVDRAGSARWGKRRSVILPLAAMAATSLVLLGGVEPTPGSIAIAVALLVVHTTFMATKDVAIDAYTVENLAPEERGVGTGVKTVFEAVGGMAAATLILFVYDRAGWLAATSCGAAVLLLLTSTLLLRREPPRPGHDPLAPRPSLALFLRRPQIVATGVLVIGGGMANYGVTVMGGAFFVDEGYTLTQVGLITGLASFLGQILGAGAAALLVLRFGSRRVLVMLALATAPAFAPLVMMAHGEGASLAAAMASAFVALILLGALHSVFTVERLGWSAGAQPGTDFTAFGAFYGIGRMAAPAVAGGVLANFGWTTLFIALAAYTAAICAAFAQLQPRLAGARARPAGTS